MFSATSVSTGMGSPAPLTILSIWGALRFETRRLPDAFRTSPLFVKDNANYYDLYHITKTRAFGTNNFDTEIIAFAFDIMTRTKDV
ncbi:MAG: hypothetical protein RSG57_04110, partial [Christensenellaceae bacterium]